MSTVPPPHTDQHSTGGTNPAPNDVEDDLALTLQVLHRYNAGCDDDNDHPFIQDPYLLKLARKIKDAEGAHDLILVEALRTEFKKLVNSTYFGRGTDNPPPPKIAAPDDSQPSLHATKSNPTASDGLLSLPENVWLNVAGYMNPNEVYHFNQAYPEIAQAVPSVIGDVNFLADNDRGYQEHQEQHQAEPEVIEAADAISTPLNIGDCCLRESQRRSLVRVLRDTSPSLFSYDKVKHLAATMRNINNRQSSPRSRMLLSGSIPLQALVGRVFSTRRTPSDLDIFVSKNALPEARNAMLALNLRCHHITFQYHSMPFEREVIIDHIESYVSDIDPDGNQTPSVSAWSLSLDRRRRRDPDLGPISKKNLLRNRAVHRVGILRPGHEEEDYDRFPRDFPFTRDADFDFIKRAELIVTRTSCSPEEAIANFDIEACKAYFDGENFGNVDDMTYLNRSTWDRNWHHWINCYIPLCIPQVNDISQRTSPKRPIRLNVLNLRNLVSDDERLLWIMSAVSQAHLSNNHCVLPCLQHGFNNCTCKLVSQTSNMFFFYLHSKIAKQFRRALKYIKRGIDVPLSDELITAFLGEATLCKLPRSEGLKIIGDCKNVSKPKPEERVAKKRAKMTPKEKQLAAEKRARITWQPPPRRELPKQLPRREPGTGTRVILPSTFVGGYAKAGEATANKGAEMSETKAKSDPGLGNC